jgi:type II secretory pathway pseudopilin PulG
MKIRQTQAGVTMIEAIVGLAMLGVLVVIMLQFLGNTNNTLKNTELESERLAAIDTLRNSVSCQNTFAGALIDPKTSCATAKYIDVRDAANNAVINAAGTALGVWSVRAQCASDGLEIRAARLTSSATAADWDFGATPTETTNYKNPMTGRLMGWAWDVGGAKKRHIIISKGQLCPEYFLSAPSGDTSGPCTSTQYFKCVSEARYKVVTGDIQFSAGTCSEGIPTAILNIKLKGIVANGTVSCPAGWRATGGGGNCRFTQGTTYGGLGYLSADIQGGGLFRHLSTTNDFLGASFAAGSTSSGYTISCCSWVYVGKTPTTNIWPPEGKGAVWATCVPEK